MRYNREIILAILRRELASRFTGSAGGWLWAVAAPLFAIAVYTFAFTTKLQMTFVGEQGQAPITYALFIFAGLIVFNFFSEMAYRSPMLLHEYAHFIKQTIFPSDMLAVISTLRAAAYTGIGAIVMLICIAAVKGGLPWTVIFMPLIFIPLAAFLMGLSWFLSAIGAFTRDAGYLMINIVPLFMFLTPVFFTHTSRPPPWDILYLPERAHRLCRGHARPRADRRAAQPAGHPVDAGDVDLHLLLRLLVLRQVPECHRRRHLRSSSGPGTSARPTSSTLIAATG